MIVAIRLVIIVGSFFSILSSITTDLHVALARLQAAYPEHIICATTDAITWSDGAAMKVQASNEKKSWEQLLNEPTLADQLQQDEYAHGMPENVALYQPTVDSGRIRYEPFFRHMYGDSAEAVASTLVPVSWMPNVFGEGTYTLLVTTVNNVHKKIAAISSELEALVDAHPEMCKYLDNPGGTFNWRVIANTTRLSAHSFGMTIDINAHASEYWQWDLKANNQEISEDALLTYRNSIPWEIVLIFEKYGFIWGGKFYHYDTMHFEYRPELFDEELISKLPNTKD
jgi:hypothetical protein